MKKPYDSLLPNLFGSDSFDSGESVTSRLLPLHNVGAIINVNTRYNPSRISCDDKDVQEAGGLRGRMLRAHVLICSFHK
jgi:hypothetical protein